MDAEKSPGQGACLLEAIHGKSILLTGATGFLGRAILYKLLSLSPGPRQIHLLVRTSDGRPDAAEERVRSELLGMGAPHGTFAASALTRIRCHSGDMTAKRLGLDEKGWDELCDSVDLIIGNAAVVRFDERVDRAVRTNALSVRTLLELARSRPRPKALVYVSTAYVHGRRQGVALELPPFPGWCPRDGSDEKAFDLDHELEWAVAQPAEVAAECPRADLDGRLRAIGRARARALGFIDTYTYSKSLAEQLLTRDGHGVPRVIVRPTIIESAWAEPEPGWIFGLRVADPLIAAYGKGQLPLLPASRAAVLDIVPVDFVTRAVLASAGHVDQESPPVFQVASGIDRPVTVGQLEQHVRAHFEAYPATDRRGRPRRYRPVRFVSHRHFDLLMRFGMEVPARACLGMTRALGGPRRLSQGASRLRSRTQAARRLVDLYADYMAYEGRFATDNTTRMMEALPTGDRECLHFRIQEIDWEHYFRAIHIDGLRRHVLGW
jgi:fatty acyl-CoA reductase